MDCVVGLKNNEDSCGRQQEKGEGWTVKNFSDR